MTKNEAFNFIVEVCGEAVLPLKNFPKLQQALKIIQEALNENDKSTSDVPSK